MVCLLDVGRWKKTTTIMLLPGAGEVGMCLLLTLKLTPI